MTFFTFLRKALSEDDNNHSAMRVKIFYLVITLVSVIAFGFVYVVVHHADLIILYLTTIVALIAAALGFKKWQKGDEIKEASRDEAGKPKYPGGN